MDRARKKHWLVLTTCCFCCCFLVFGLLSSISSRGAVRNLFYVDPGGVRPKWIERNNNKGLTKPTRLQEFHTVNKDLLGEGGASLVGAVEEEPHACLGVVECPREYEKLDVEISACMGALNELQIYMNQELYRHHQEMRERCQEENNAILPHGGWCLQEDPANKLLVTLDHGAIELPKYEFPASSHIVNVLVGMIRDESIKSITEFGAGVGQYKSAVTAAVKGFAFHAHGNAGNVEAFTDGYVTFADWTAPLALEKSDWVLSMEVGANVPSAYEGIFLRNLHYHNCKGILLSWPIMGQDGRGHINNHSNQYIIDIMQQLDYRYDQAQSEKFRHQEEGQTAAWFQHNFMVFRRNIPVCSFV